jgi:hypothetical protein
MARKQIEKMTQEEIKEYYENRAILYGALFAFVLLAIAFIGFFLGFNGGLTK